MPEAVLTLSNNLAELERLSTAVEGFCAQHGLAGPGAAMVLALDELLTNVICYGYEDSALHEISVTLRAEGGRLTVQVEDDGRAFDPRQAPPPDLTAPIEDRRIGGLGVHIARTVVDSLDYERRGNINRVVLAKAAR